jgi:hypothetical protein
MLLLLLIAHGPARRPGHIIRPVPGHLDVDNKP